MLARHSKLPLGSSSHQLLIKLVSHSSTRVLTDVTNAAECFSCLYTVSAKRRVVVYKCCYMYVCLQSSSVAVSLITNTWQLRLQPPQLPAIGTSSLVFSRCFYIFSSSRSFHSLPTHPLFLSSCAPFQSVDHASRWLFALTYLFFRLFLHVLHGMPDGLQTHILARHLDVCVYAIDILEREENATYCKPTDWLLNILQSHASQLWILVLSLLQHMFWHKKWICTILNRKTKDKKPNFKEGFPQ